VTAGGIGNQLFQLYFAHFLNEYSGSRVNVVQYDRMNGLPHTRFSLTQVIRDCDHITLVEKSSTKLNEYLDPWTKRLTLNPSCLDTRNTPFVSPSEFEGRFNEQRVHIGYFQNWSFVNHVERLALRDLHWIIKRGQSDFKEQLGEFDVIHVRGGDVRTENNKAVIGILSSDYYRNFLDANRSRMRVVVTDDLEWAKTIIPESKVDRFFGPKELHPLDSLAIMSAATRLCAANSAFSWLGGFLSLAQGAEVYFPDPIFKSPKLHSKGALLYPGFSAVQSSFL